MQCICSNAVARRWVDATEIRKFPMLRPDQESAYAKRWREQGDREAAYHLVTSHLRLVAKIAMRYRGYGLPIADIISEGNVGLMQAVKRSARSNSTLPNSSHPKSSTRSQRNISARTPISRRFSRSSPTSTRFMRNVASSPVSQRCRSRTPKRSA